MSEFKILTFKEISDALNAGKHVEVEGGVYNPFKLIDGYLVDSREDRSQVSDYIVVAMRGVWGARILEPKLTRWIVVHRFGEGDMSTQVYDSEKDTERAEEYWKDKGLWIRTVKVEA